MKENWINFKDLNECLSVTDFDVGGPVFNLLEEDIMLPAAVVKKSGVTNNCEWMQEYVAISGVSIAPHGKTTMSPRLFEIQMENGAWGMTLANVFQIRTARKIGINRILLANQLVGKQSISYIVNEINEYPEFEFYCLVDNAENIIELSKYVKNSGMNRPLDVLIEIGPDGGRAGVRSLSEAVKLAELIRRLGPSVRLCGIECYEGVIHGCGAVRKVEDLLRSVAAIASELDSRTLFDVNKVILSGGGTAYFDLVVKVFKEVGLSSPYEIVIRPGCYISHDSGIYEEFQQALVARDTVARSIEGGLVSSVEVLSYVQSIPEAGIAILNMGKRDVSFDSGLPVPKSIYDPKTKCSVVVGAEFEIFDLNDQHAYLRYPNDHGIRVGDILISNISHPCLTFDKWGVIPVVDDEYNILEFLNTCF